MADRQRPKMDVAERAKQFLPFAALKGLPEALAVYERIVVSKMELSEDSAVELDRKMQRIERGKILSVIYFHEGEYLKKTGMVARIDSNSRILQVVETRICFDDILDVEVMPDGQ